MGFGATTEEAKKIDLSGYQGRALGAQEDLYNLQRRTPTYTLPPVVPMTESQQTAQRLGTGYAFGDRPL